MLWIRPRDWIISSASGPIPAMSVEHLFTQALGLGTPWQVVSSAFDPVAKSLEPDIDFLRGRRFSDPAT